METNNFFCLIGYESVYLKNSVYLRETLWTEYLINKVTPTCTQC